MTTHRTRLYAELAEAKTLPCSWEEVEVHFAGMPLRYWLRADGPTLRWHLEIIQKFFSQLVEADSVITAPVVRWRHFPKRGITEVAVCTWDRQGLLVKVAGALAMVGLNIVRADVYTRADDVVLDVFQVSTPDKGHVADESSLAEMAELLAAALSSDGDRAVLASRQIEKVLGSVATSRRTKLAPIVTFDNEHSAEYTVLYLEARDRLGLLYAILQAISACDVNIAHAIITTENDTAADVFYVTDARDRKIEDKLRLEHLRAALGNALG
jgi:[protein-PII] uridylyltransferase